MVHVFFVGGTGHIGGAVLDQFLRKYAHTNVKVLVRDEAKAARLGTVYPQVECVVGDAGDLEVLEKCSQAADIVINTAPDITHDEGIRAILSGLKARGETIKNDTPCYIHTSGASLIWDEPTGSKDARWWDDIVDIQDICAFKGAAQTHAVTDKIVRDAAPYVNVAIISPGFVGGMSPSIEHPTPITMPAILLTARAFKSGWQIAGGQDVHAWIHVLDLARMYMILVGKAIDGVCESEPFPIWGPDAYYFGTSEDISFGTFMKHLVHVLKKQRVIESTEIKSVNVAEAARASIAGSDYDPNTPPPPLDTWALHIAIMYGINMRIGASRMKRLGWNAEMGTLVDSFPQVVAEHLKREKLSYRN
ncbi:Putative NAD(P)-binding domain, NAD(P)-binding domain superfamily [Colletotrichum destructivum]|uniref:NAD(P)-binding domain, NAD(P)-binding domain superfamily n=1 Tax=Colletotrichum destructivum TaxID=34406 RepID=A0AAX4I2X2_9PEZI|nr:Putative NAD(P)-binding domain, NAD(P)-binding domain superfamily [Colletotrichum destructivum]